MSSPPKKPSGAERDAVLEDLRKRYEKTLNLLIGPTSPPLWQRVTQAIQCYERLRIDSCPPIWQRRIDLTFRRVYAIAKKYPIKEWDDYQRISDEDLESIKDIILELPFSTKS